MAEHCAINFLALQKDQYRHDARNHHDIHSFPIWDRLKHYGLHFCKYAGRIARGPSEVKPYEATLIDTFLVVLSAANTLNQNLGTVPALHRRAEKPNDRFNFFIDAAGRFADACEKHDHGEDYATLAKVANADIALWSIWELSSAKLEIAEAVEERRKELADRKFYI